MAALAYLGCIEEELLPPDQPGLEAQLHDVLEEAAEVRQAEPLADAGQAGVVGQRLVQVVAEVPAVRQVEGDRLHELALGPQTLEEHDQLELEEDHGVDARAPAGGVAVAGPLAHEAQVELGVEVTRGQGDSPALDTCKGVALPSSRSEGTPGD